MFDIWTKFLLTANAAFVLIRSSNPIGDDDDDDDDDDGDKIPFFILLFLSGL